MRYAKLLLVLLFFAWAPAGGAPLPVVATTSIVGDVVAQVGGERIALTVLIPAGTDPHTFEPTPRDLVLLSRARLVFVNGAGLEEGLAPLLASPELRGKVVDLSQGLELRELGD
ncbi:MAG: metal ABC transporter substrate-binding protein, partial [Candidatus Bipolaricaulota bacterium]|nr:metal ABC transporter substrate-binding protein [Candidatus Bipolaricaulota bacterium]